jgi:hypothetical protein
MVVYGLAFGNQGQPNGGDFGARADDWWPEAACASCLNGLCGGARDLSRDALGVADFRDAQIVGALDHS